MAQESQVTDVVQDMGGPTLASPMDQSEEGKRNSLLSKVKDKAKGTVKRLKSKVKKGSDDSTDDVSSAKTGSQSGEEQTSDDSEESSASEAQRDSNGGPQSAGIDGVQEEQNSSDHRVFFGIKPEDDILKPFARSEGEKNPFTVTPLIATPTSYGEPHTTVEDVMPPSMIEPTSVSELGEESSSNLGKIPEAKDEEKAAAEEVVTGGPDADINGGFKETFHQKDLQAIDGLPKPRGFDVGNEGKVYSGELGFHTTQALAGQTPSRKTVANGEGAEKGGDRQFPVDGAAQSRGTEEDNEKPHPRGSVAEFKDSMFTSNAISGLKPNEPNAAEAKRAGEIGTFSRDFDPETAKSGSTEGDQQHPPGSKAEPQDSMFSSGASHDLKANEPNAAEAKHAGEVGTFSRDFDPETAKSGSTEGDQQHPPGSKADPTDSMFSSGATHDLKPNEPNAAEAKHAAEIGTFSRGFEPEASKSSSRQGDEGTAPIGDRSLESDYEGNENFQDSPEELPPPALAGDVEDVSHLITEDSRQIDDSSDGMEASFLQGNRATTAEEEAENYFDTVTDDDSLPKDSDISEDFHPEATDEYHKQSNYLTESANARVKAAMNDEIKASTARSDGDATEGTSMLVSTVESVVDSVVSKFRLFSPAPQSSSSQSQASTVHGTTSDKVSSLISTAIGVLLPEDEEDGSSNTPH